MMGFFWQYSRTVDSRQESFGWREGAGILYFSWKSKHFFWSFLFHTTLIDRLELCRLLWCFYQLFKLMLMAPIHCKGSFVSRWCNAKIHLFYIRKLISSWMSKFSSSLDELFQIWNHFWSPFTFIVWKRADMFIFYVPCKEVHRATLKQPRGWVNNDNILILGCTWNKLAMKK